MRPTRADEVSVLEAAYRLEGTETEWLEGLARAATPFLDEGWGVFASTWYLEPKTVRLRASVGLGGPPGMNEAAQAAGRESSSINFGMFLSGPCSSLATIGAEKQVVADPGSRALLSLGIRDCLAVMNADPGGYGSALTAYRGDRTVLPRRIVSRWSRIASHLGAGFRVRRGLEAMRVDGARPDVFAASEAIFTPAGRLEHAAEPAQNARKALAEGVAAIGRARGKLRARDPDVALEAWRGLIAGRWSLVDHVDTDGKRYLVARRNDPRVCGAAAVSDRERQIMAARARGLPLKLIAYEFGLSIGAVSRGLQSGMAKLGFVHQTELVTLFARSTSAQQNDLRASKKVASR
jgi:DNA-binding CsgD family transcriptional regulator